MKNLAYPLLFIALSTLLVTGTAFAQGSGSNSMMNMGGQHKGGPVGKPGDPAKVSRTIQITMNDTMRFTPDSITVKAGETIRFDLKNDGKLPHEWVIGSMDELKEHAEMMRKMPGKMEPEPTMMGLEPGKSGSIVWLFDEEGTMNFACLIPGHMEAGMVGKVIVE